ncbi:MAG TPA: hypothetical protein VFP28_05195 [Gemmatimonadales bacterium]|nr:hypothetical protein [Gemmatimonadales bacterium]
MTLERLLHAAAALLAVSLSACGGSESKPSPDVPQDAAADTAAAPDPAPAVPGQVPLTVADIDRWDRGMGGELEAIHGAAARLRAAKTGDDSVTAMMGVQDMATVEAGAKAAGVDQDRYQLIRTNLSAAASYLAPHIGGVDTTALSAEQRAEMARNNMAQLEQMKDVVPPDVVAALTPRAAELRTRDLELAVARLKAAGM